MIRSEGSWRQTLARGGLAQRVAAAMVMLPVALLLVWLGGWPFLLALAAAAMLMFWELYRLPWPEAVAPASRAQRHVPAGRLPERGALRTEFWLVSGGVLALLLLCGLSAWGAAIVLLVAIIAIAAAFAGMTGRNPGWAALRVVYVGLPCLSLAWLRDAPVSATGIAALDGQAATLTLLAIVWTADSLAYLFGRGIGGPRLAPRVSPNKTWAGLAGAIVGGILVGGIAALVLDLSLPGMVAAGMILAIVAQLGDLVASAVKRHYMVKDYSGLIPGHGGLLDRIDGVLFVAPPGVLLLWLIGWQ